MKKKLPRTMRPNVWFHFLLLFAFAVATYFFGGYSRLLSAAMLAVTVLAAVFLRISTKRRNEKLISYLDSISGSMNLTIRDTPLPVFIYNSVTGEVIWSSAKFSALVGTDGSFFSKNVNDILPDFTWDWLTEGKHESEEPVKIGERYYRVYGSLSRSKREYIAITYWLDVTEYIEICNSYIDSRPVHVLMTLDNYDELFKGMSAKDKSLLLSDIDEIIGTWSSGKDGFLCRYERDRYFFLFEERFLEAMVKDNFSVLDKLNTCVGAGGVVATLSIGIGKDGASPYESYRFASLGMEMALSRGGNQAVIRNKYGFEFYGGRPQPTERRTKVKARVMANAFAELLSDASKIYIMGHKDADYDSIGASVGLCCIARIKRKPAFIIIGQSTQAVSPDFLNLFLKHPEYNGIFITEQEAVLEADKKTLLVVVDTNRPGQVESQTLLLSCTRIAVIDHHRRAADYIDNAVLNFHEPYASSTAELVTDMMQNLVDRSDEILRIEAEALLAGIVLDTKGFSINTGSGTFDAAAYLKRSGANTESVKSLLQSDFEIVSARSSLMSTARIYKAGIALAVSEEQHSRISIAQAADELLEIRGVHTSFAMAPDGNTVCVSGRNIGNINVQVILEALGGGGSQATAGYQTDSKSVKQVASELKQSIDLYLKNTGRVKS